MLLEDWHIRSWCARARRNNVDFFLDDNLDQFGNIMHHQHQIYGKRLVGGCANLANFFTKYLSRHAARANNAQPASIGYSTYEWFTGNLGHSTLENRVLDTEQFCNIHG